MCFLSGDEAPEFQVAVLQTLRQPLESGEVVLHRANATARYPARFQLVMAANPCPCGLSGSRCSCGGGERRRYLARLSGPLLDRVDIQVPVPRVTRAMAAIGGSSESSADVAARVQLARERQQVRYRGLPWAVNGSAAGTWLRHPDQLPEVAARRGLERLVDRGDLTMRGLDRVLRLSWTLADLTGEERPGPAEVAIATTLRMGDPHA